MNADSLTLPTAARKYRSGSETRKRAHVIQVRVSDAERAAIAAAAAERGLTAPDYLRLCFEAMQLIEQREEAQR